MQPRVISPPLEELPNLRQPLTEGENIVLEFFLVSSRHLFIYSSAPSESVPKMLVNIGPRLCNLRSKF